MAQNTQCARNLYLDSATYNGADVSGSKKASLALPLICCVTLNKCFP